MLPTLDGYLTEAGELCLARCEIFMQALAQMEEMVMKEKEEVSRPSRPCSRPFPFRSPCLENEERSLKPLGKRGKRSFSSCLASCLMQLMMRDEYVSHVSSWELVESR